MRIFKDKVAIVTGGASGMGRVICDKLSAAGGKVVIADIDGTGAENVVQEIQGQGGQAKAAQLDTSCDADVKALVADTAAEYGRLDYMFNNAGILIAGETRDMGDEEWARILGVNFQGVLSGTLAAYKIMVEQGFGHIVNTASAAGLVALPTLAAYTTTKHAIVGLSNSLRQEGARLGVKISVVCPGFVGTSIFDKGRVVRGDMDELLSAIPIKPISPEKAANCILKGVAANRGMIVFPFTARLLWLTYRTSPAFFSWATKKVAEDFRKIRKE